MDSLIERQIGVGCPPDVREFKPAMQELSKTGEIGIVEVIASDALFGLDELERAKEWAAG